jgi:hypothetical protein
MVMDRIAADLAGMPKRSDLGMLLVDNQSGNDELYFVSHAPGYAPSSGGSNSGLTLVGYRVNTNGFQRVGKGLGWDALAFTNLTVASLQNNYDIDYGNATDTNYHTISPSVLRAEYALLMKPGTVNYDASGTNPIGTNSPTEPSYLKTNCVGPAINNVEAIQVVIAVLDQNSRKIVKSTSLEGLAGSSSFPDFRDPGRVGVTSGVAFGQWLSNAPNAPAPRAAASQIRIYQRIIPLN